MHPQGQLLMSIVMSSIIESLYKCKQLSCWETVMIKSIIKLQIILSCQGTKTDTVIRWRPGQHGSALTRTKTQEIVQGAHKNESYNRM